jgi:hypothetical protein
MMGARVDRKGSSAKVIQMLSFVSSPSRIGIQMMGYHYIPAVEAIVGRVSWYNIPEQEKYTKVTIKWL